MNLFIYKIHKVLFYKILNIAKLNRGFYNYLSVFAPQRYQLNIVTIYIYIYMDTLAGTR